MPNSKDCPLCKGLGSIEALVSQHDDKKEKCICPTCKGAGVIHEMTDQEEADYHADYW